MKVLVFLFVSLFVSASYADLEFVAYKLDGKYVQTAKDAEGLIGELEKMKTIEDYEFDSGLCIEYVEDGQPNPKDQLESVLNAAGFSIVLEGIYGEDGNHMFEVYSTGEESKYIGAISGIYPCE